MGAEVAGVVGRAIDQAGFSTAQERCCCSTALWRLLALWWTNCSAPEVDSF
jgi:hypothetical protein